MHPSSARTAQTATASRLIFQLPPGRGLRDVRLKFSEDEYGTSLEPADPNVDPDLVEEVLNEFRELYGATIDW